MATLHIEHPITDFGTWKAAFDRFAEAREKSGVRGHRILRPVDDAHYVVIDLDFQTASEAEKFLGFLQTALESCQQGKESSLFCHLQPLFPSPDKIPDPTRGMGDPANVKKLLESGAVFKSLFAALARTRRGVMG